MDAGNKEQRPPNPRARANIFEIFTFSWIFDLFKIGRKRDLEFNDLYVPLNNDRSSLLGIELQRRWKIDIVNANKNNGDPSLLRVLVRMFGAKLMFYGLIQAFVEIVLRMSLPILIGGLLEYFNPEKPDAKDLNHAYYYASGLLLNMLLNIILFHYSQMEMGHLGMKIRVACCSAIYKKALRLSQTSLGETTVGQVVNLLSNDVNRFDIAFIFIHFLWVGPLQSIVVTYFLWQELGVSSLVGVAIFLVFIPLQGWLGKKTSKYRSRTAPRTDERVRLMNEIISGIQVIKMYTWEKPFAVLVQFARKMELEQIRGVLYIRVFLQSFVIFHLRIAFFISILSYVLLGNFINTQKVFVILSYLKILTTMTVFFPQGILTLAEMLISIKRIQTFLLQHENRKHDTPLSLQPEVTSKNSNEMLNFNSDHFATNINKNEEGIDRLGNFGIDVSNASAKWVLNQPDNSLNNINLTVRPGRLVAIIGPVGAGKANILAEGSYQELQSSGLDFTKLLKPSDETTADTEIDNKNEPNSDFEPISELSRQGSLKSISSSIDENKLNETQVAPIEVAEARSSGKVSLLATGGDYWISYWVNLEDRVFRKEERRILNRFTKDIGAIDEMITVPSLDFIYNSLSLIGIIVVVGIVNVYLLIPTFFIGILFYYTVVYYLSTSRSIKRLEGISRSPVLGYLNASLQGLSTIRAFDAEEILSREFDGHQDLHSSAWYIFISSTEALGFALDMICLAYINAFGGDVGLVITQAMSLTGSLQWGIRQFAQLDNQMTSVERVLEYTNVPQEPALESVQGNIHLSLTFKMEAAGHKEKQLPNPRNKANIFEILTFSWILKFLKRDLEIIDLYNPLNDHKSSLLGYEIEKRWKVEIINAKSTNRKPSLLRVLVRMFGGSFLYYGIIQMFIETMLR
ncbi:PREDICTED: probable multidrug resistance-associated protein lethal(2)03659 [Diuraphis noxia]|uniref:probable multidrug resistance-associated protein lethal(2)03659 n=1 Tax=Diuraphis noxia TaxID=143948 RepID=UPI000763591F|nr:PREDICTED: probable multidrug resistance-associated protein lethal(2)03659 [Diuraphis noxia]